MEIALVHDPLYKLGGAERVLEALHNLYPKAPVFTPIYDPVGTRGRFAKWDIRPSFLQKWPGRLRFLNFYRVLMPLSVEAWDLRDFDLVISSVTSVAKGVLTRQDALHIAYLHNVTRFAWMDVGEHVGGSFKLSAWPARLALSGFRQWDFLAADRPDVVVANSHNTARRIKKYYRREVEEIIYPPVDVERFRISRKIGDFFLIVSRLEPHKKIDIAVKAFNELGLPLKIVGEGPEYDVLRSLAKPNVEFLGRLSDPETAELMSQCLAFVYPQEEDFGISAVEAQASGRPVIALGAGGARETIKPGQTGQFFAEQTPASLAAAVKKFRPQAFDPVIIRRHAETYGSETFRTKFASLVARKLEHGIKRLS